MSPWQRAVGFGNYLVSGPMAAAEQSANFLGAFGGNIADQLRLRGQGRFAEAEAAAISLGRRWRRG